MSETANTPPVATTQPAQPYVLPEDPRGELTEPEIAAADIRPFQWTESHYHQAFELGTACSTSAGALCFI